MTGAAFAVSRRTCVVATDISCIVAQAVNMRNCFMLMTATRMLQRIRRSGQRKLQRQNAEQKQEDKSSHGGLVY